MPAKCAPWPTPTVARSPHLQCRRVIRLYQADLSDWDGGCYPIARILIRARIDTATMTDTPLYAAAGLLVGTLVGLTGVGGGSIMTPILLLLFGQSPAVAVGTDLLFAAITKLVATAAFGFNRRVDWPIVGRLLLG